MPLNVELPSHAQKDTPEEQRADTPTPPRAEDPRCRNAQSVEEVGFRNRRFRLEDGRGNRRRPGGQAEALQDRPRGVGRMDRGEDSQRSVADRALQDVHREHRTYDQQRVEVAKIACRSAPGRSDLLEQAPLKPPLVRFGSAEGALPPVDARNPMRRVDLQSCAGENRA